MTRPFTEAIGEHRQTSTKKNLPDTSLQKAFAFSPIQSNPSHSKIPSILSKCRRFWLCTSLRLKQMTSLFLFKYFHTQNPRKYTKITLVHLHYKTTHSTKSRMRTQHIIKNPLASIDHILVEGYQHFFLRSSKDIMCLPRLQIATCDEGPWNQQATKELQKNIQCIKK